MLLTAARAPISTNAVSGQLRAGEPQIHNHLVGFPDIFLDDKQSFHANPRHQLSQPPNSPRYDGARSMFREMVLFVHTSRAISIRSKSATQHYEYYLR